MQIAGHKERYNVGIRKYIRDHNSSDVNNISKGSKIRGKKAYCPTGNSDMLKLIPILDWHEKMLFCVCVWKKSFLQEVSVP